MSSFDFDKIFRVSDLNKHEFAPTSLAVFGKPIAHSLSPKMQNAALKELAKCDAKYHLWAYYKFEIDPSELCEVLPKFHAANFSGINLTIPHKELVFACASSCNISFDKFSKMAGACNTLIRTKDGWNGSNTDGFGLEKAVENLCGRTFKDADIVIFGAGGAARAASFKVLLDRAKSLKISNRSPDKLAKLLEEIKLSNFEACRLSAIDEISENSILINATSLGLNKNDAPVIDFSRVPKSCIFFDMPYVRGGETVSVEAARIAGLKASSGLEMLAWQGAKALSLWTGDLMQGELMARVLRENE